MSGRTSCFVCEENCHTYIELGAHMVDKHPDTAKRIIADTAKLFDIQQDITDAWDEPTTERQR